MNKRLKINIKLIITIFVTIFLLTTGLSFYAVAENRNEYTPIIKKYSFDTPITEQVSINEVIYDRVILKDSPRYGNIGEYDLPAHGAYLLLNPGDEIINIEVIPGEKVLLGSNINLEVVTQPTRLSNIDIPYPESQFELKDISDDIYPGSLYTMIGTYCFRGYEILVLLLHPVQYIPHLKTLYYFKDLEVQVSTKNSNQLNSLFRNKENDKIEAIKKIDNPVAISSYNVNKLSPLSSKNYDLLILTTDEFDDVFKSLKQTHDANGISTEIKTLKDISLFPGSVEPIDIRNFIREEYIKNGIEYVLIGGDEDVVPVQKLWVQSWPNGDTADMPSDLYYACLDGTFNYDNDEKWGERFDGDGGKSVDLVAEVYIGRACIGSISEAYNFVDKTIDYINSGGYSSGSSLVVGEHLWSNPDTWGGDYMDELIDGSNANSYTTVGIPSSIYSIDKLYDRDWSGNSWPKSEIKDRINNGALVINHLGHSSYGYNMKMVNNDILYLTNDEPCFVYSQGCNAGGFDHPSYDCIAEYFTVKTDRAAFAVIMNARYGWGVKGDTDGASQRFHREFWDAIFSEDILEIGKANQDSKEDTIPYINRACMRWCYYQLNLFGDPTLIFHNSENNKPNKPTRPVGINTGSPGKEYNFSTTVADPDDDKIYLKWDWGNGTFSKWLGPYNSGEKVTVSQQWSKWGLYKVRVKARDEHRAESDWSNPLTIILPRYLNFPLLKQIFNFLEEYFPQIYSIIYKIIY